MKFKFLNTIKKKFKILEILIKFPISLAQEVCSR